jgi:hypothetical protein
MIKLITFMRIFLFLLVFGLIACKQKTATQQGTSTLEGAEQSASPTNTTAPPDFVEFYQKFHADPAYQIAHITWPLSGVHNSQGEDQKPIQTPTTYTQENWVIHKPFDNNSNDFIQTLTVVSDQVIEESIRYRAAQYGLQRRFAKMSDEWYLIYYSDMQELPAK